MPCLASTDRGVQHWRHVSRCAMTMRMQILHFDDPAAFTPAECAAIVALAGASAMDAATVWSSDGDTVDPQIRSAMRCHWRRGGAPDWVFDRLDTLFAGAAARFEVAADPVFEAIQIVRYGPGDHFHVWHSDAGVDRFWERQVSLSVELSDPGGHDGGVLEMAPARPGAKRSLPQGGARIFLSRAIHRVTPVTRGERWALVAWTGRDPARQAAGAVASSG